MKIKCILIDDEPLAIKVLQNYFTNFSDFEIIGTFNNALESLEFINNNAVDAVFLDINMPMMTGFELISLIENKTRVIITSAFREFAVESYDLDVLDYLLKPINYIDLLETIKKYYPKLKIVARGTTLKAFGEKEVLDEFEKRFQRLMLHFTRYNTIDDNVIERVECKRVV